MFESKSESHKSEKVEDRKQERKEYIRENKDKIIDKLQLQSRRVIEEAEKKIGKGNSARVFVDERKPDICYKVIYRGLGVNTPGEEVKLLERAREVISEKARVPDPVQEIVFDYKEDGEELRCSSYAMERIDGMTLEEIMEKRKFPKGAEPKSMEDFKVLRTTFRDVHKLINRLNRELGIYHRDLRARNVMLDTKGIWWIIDFGKAKKEYFQNEEQTGDSRDIKEVWDSFVEFLGPYVKNLKSS